MFYIACCAFVLMKHNGFGLGEEADFEKLNCQ